MEKKAKKILITLSFFLILECIFFFLYFFFFALAKNAGWAALGYGLIGSIWIVSGYICGIISLILLLMCLKSSFIFSAVFICVCLFVMISPFLGLDNSELLRPLAKKYNHYRFERNQQVRERKRLSHYDLLVKHFQTPQKVIAIKGYYLLLADGKQIELYAFNHWSQEKECEEYLKRTILEQDKLVQIRLPDRSDFFRLYRLSRKGNTGLPETDWKPPYYGDIPALVYVDDELLNIKYCSSARKYIKE